MSNRELLEMAANAAGYNIEWLDYAQLMNGARWNPLEDDGDALRLAGRLMMEVRILNGCAYAETLDGAGGKIWFYEEDILRAARKAIVSAAAEIARQTP